MLPSPLGKILFVVAHPHLVRSRANRAVVEAVAGIPGLTMNVLYDRYPYFNVDVEHEKALLFQHELIVVQHPLYWYSMPPLMKLWLDEVFESGWAYGPGGDALKGKRFLASVTAGGSFEAYSPTGYNRFPIETYMTAWNQTAHLCKMQWLEPAVLHSSIRSAPDAIQAHAQALRDRLIALTRGGAA